MSDADPYIGRTLDKRYLVRRLIGRGGMGAVYEADHIGLDRRVAIKFLLGGRSNADMVARFQREARAASKVENEHVVQIYDVGTDDSGVDFIAMEFIEGENLERLLRGGPVAVSRAVHIGKQLLTGLQAIHDGGILHRDIKPGNVQLTEQDGDPDFVKIMDFGISKLIGGAAPAITHAGHVVGTPQYMSPEQLAGLDVDHRSDLYAAALTMYELVAGTAPFSGGNTDQIVAMHLSQDARPLDQLVPGIPGAIARAIHRGLEKSPDRRFASAAEFVDALGGPVPTVAPRTAQSTPTRDSRDVATVASKRVPREEAPQASTATTATTPAKRARWPLVVAGLLVLGVPVGVFLSMRRSSGAQAPAVLVVADASVRLDAMTPLAPEPTESAAATTSEPGGMICHCLQTPALDLALCGAIAGTPMCGCEAGPLPLCAGKPAAGYCVRSYLLHPAMQGKECKGWEGAHMERETMGTVRCVYCPAPQQHRGRPNASCVGYNPYTGEKVSGVLSACTPE